MIRRKKRLIPWQQRIFPYVLITPNTLIFLVFIIVPAIQGVRYSLTEWSGLGAPEFIALENYAKAFADTKFWQAFGNTCVYALFTLPLIVIVPLLLACLMIRDIPGKGVFRSLFYWPSMISYIVIGIAFKFIFSDTTGIVNYLLEIAGLAQVEWLTQRATAMGVVILATVWSRTGFFMVMFMSGLQSISTSYYEAAVVDGASSMQKFMKITIPLLRPTMFLVTILGLIDLFKAYGLVIALTGGGPAGGTKFVVQYVYEKAFSEMNLGYASALSIILMVVLAVFTGIQFAINKGGRVNA